MLSLNSSRRERLGQREGKTYIGYDEGDEVERKWGSLGTKSVALPSFRMAVGIRNDGRHHFGGVERGEKSGS